MNKYGCRIYSQRLKLSFKRERKHMTSPIICRDHFISPQNLAYFPGKNHNMKYTHSKY
ncbi:hypothetical protein Hanom_Chr03g00204841 [Helianthus anomalus]